MIIAKMTAGREIIEIYLRIYPDNHTRLLMSSVCVYGDLPLTYFRLQLSNLLWHA